MLQKIIETSDQKLMIHTLESGTLIQGFEIDLLDEETLGLEQIEVLLRSLCRSLDSGCLLRFIMKSEYLQNSSEGHSRHDAIKSIGYIKNRAFVFLEKRPNIDLSFLRRKNLSKKDSKTINLDLSFLKESGVEVKPLSSADIQREFPLVPNEINHHFQTIDLGNEVLSILRLTRQSEFGMDMKTLSALKDGLPLPYSIVCTVQALPQASAETMLRRKSKQNANGEDLKEGRKFSEAQEDLEDVSLNGTKLFHFEWLCTIPRKNEEYLRADREEFKRKLSELGEAYIESVGALPSYMSSMIGEAPHFKLLEKDTVLPCYIPLVTRGEPQSLQKSLSRSLAVHRRDESLCNIDIFDPKYDSFSWCIFGRPGTGKSVLVNAITRSLAFDAEIKIIKIDVGGSHSRETKLLGGVEKTLNLNEPTGINPFDVIRELGSTKEALQILASFLEVLMLEEGESKLSKTMKSDLEKSILHYADLNPQEMGLHDFYDYIQDLPRRDLLRRWVGNSVYGNAFAKTNDPSQKINLSSALTYFNFSKISQALDPDYAQGGLAAVMAQFNLEMLKKAEHKKRIVFIADETPFFIKKCFSFFNLSIANVRKEGHGFITVAQKSSHVVIDGDTGILDNSPNKIFFSLDGDEESFKSRTQLSSEAVTSIQSLQRRQGEFSEAFLKDQRGERVIKIRLSRDEYWSYTSKDEDKRKLQELAAACPGLSLKEIIRCLSLS